MAQFRNVSGQDRHLSLPDWFSPRLVEAGQVIDVEDDIAAQYDFNQPSVWEPLQAAPAPVDASKDGK